MELFFDLAYVVAVAELARAFASDLTWHGAAVFAGLFTVIWSSWVGFTLYANRFDTDDVVFRLIKLAATLTAAGCAASAADADSSTGRPSAPASSPAGSSWSGSTCARGGTSVMSGPPPPRTWSR